MKIKFDNIRINYDDFGQGPVVVFAPQGHYNSQVWNAHVGPLITAGYRVILLEFIDAPNTEACSQAVIKMLNYLGIGRAAICGMNEDKLILQLITDYPQRIACVCHMTNLTYRDQNRTYNSADIQQISEIQIPYETGGGTTRQLIDFLSIFAPRNARRSTAAFANAA